MPETLSQSLADFRQALAAFLESTVGPLEGSLGSGEEADDSIRAEVRRQSTEAGFWPLEQPRELGGLAAGPLQRVVARETLAASNLRLARQVIGPSPGLLAQTEGDTRTRYLEPFLRGELRSAFAFTEPSDAEAPTAAHWDADELIVSGRKSYVTGGARAHAYLTLVNVRDDDSAKAGTAVLIIDRDSPGVEIDERFESLDGSEHVALRFESVRVPAWHRVGAIGSGMTRALGEISGTRLLVAAHAVGRSIWILGELERSLAAPHRSGRPLADRESIRLRYADLRIATWAARSSLYRGARLVDNGDAAVNEVMIVKVLATETAGRVIDEAVQLCGGRALVVGHPFEALYRELRSLRLAEGASDLLRLGIARGRFDLGKGTL